MTRLHVPRAIGLGDLAGANNDHDEKGVRLDKGHTKKSILTLTAEIL